MGTITETLARWACDLKYDDIDANSVDAAKRFLYDSLGCALGGFQTGDVKIFLDYLREMGGTGPCTVVGAGDKLDPVSAAMLNALMIRAMDYNDIYWKQDPSHPSDLMSAPLALAERGHMTGKDLIVGIVLGHEIEMRLCHVAVPGIRERGWHHATLTAYASPIVAGRMLGLTWPQMQHAIGIASCHSFTLGCAVAGKLTMMKNTVSPMATRDGVEAALLAQKGYTGPEGVIEGKEGMVHCLGQAWDLSWLTDGLGDKFMIAQCGMKAFPTEALTHSPITATLYLIRKHDLKAEDVREVHIESIARAADILSDPSKYNPQSKETADHSLPWCIAAALADRMVTPQQFKEQKLHDQRLRAQLNKVKVVANPEFERAFPAKQCTNVTITTTAGQSYSHRIDVPKGDPRDPMTEEDLRIKFDALADPIMTEQRRRQIRDTVFALDDLADVERLMRLTVSDRSVSP